MLNVTKPTAEQSTPIGCAPHLELSTLYDSSLYGRARVLLAPAPTPASSDASRTRRSTTRTAARRATSAARRHWASEPHAPCATRCMASSAATASTCATASTWTRWRRRRRGCARRVGASATVPRTAPARAGRPRAPCTGAPRLCGVADLHESFSRDAAEIASFVCRFAPPLGERGCELFCAKNQLQLSIYITAIWRPHLTTASRRTCLRTRGSPAPRGRNRATLCPAARRSAPSCRASAAAPPR